MEVKVIEVIGIDPPAEKALWQYLFGIDLVTSIDCWNLRVDDPCDGGSSSRGDWKGKSKTGCGCGPSMSRSL